VNLSNSAYDKLKFLVQIVLPGLAALYVGLAQLWSLPEPTAVAGTIAAVAAFLGLFLSRQAASYEGAGDLVLHKDVKDGEVYQSVDWNDHPGTLKDGQNVTLNVRTEEVDV
jgi:hypothetical protein